MSRYARTTYQLSQAITTGTTWTSDHPDAWKDQGLCREFGADLWFPAQGAGACAREAKRICGGCPVRTECLGYALENSEPAGIWGGLTYPERLRLLRSAAS